LSLLSHRDARYLEVITHRSGSRRSISTMHGSGVGARLVERVSNVMIGATSSTMNTLVANNSRNGGNLEEFNVSRDGLRNLLGGASDAGQRGNPLTDCKISSWSNYMAGENS
jgi:hypothetical protein